MLRTFRVRSARGLPREPLQYTDELYWDLILGRRGTVQGISHTRAPGQMEGDNTQQPVFWTV